MWTPRVLKWSYISAHIIYELNNPSNLVTWFLLTWAALFVFTCAPKVHWGSVGHAGYMCLHKVRTSQYINVRLCPMCNFLPCSCSLLPYLVFTCSMETKDPLRISRTYRTVWICKFYPIIQSSINVQLCPASTKSVVLLHILHIFSFTSRARLSFSFPSLSALIKRSITFNRWSQISSQSFLLRHTIILLSFLPWQMKDGLLLLFLHLPCVLPTFSVSCWPFVPSFPKRAEHTVQKFGWDKARDGESLGGGQQRTFLIWALLFPGDLIWSEKF